MRSSHQGQLVGPVVVPEESLRGITVMGHIPLIALKGMEQASDQANVVGRAATGPATTTGQVSREDTITEPSPDRLRVTEAKSHDRSSRTRTTLPANLRPATPNPHSEASQTNTVSPARSTPH